jgi:hypothetical protein
MNPPPEDIVESRASELAVIAGRPSDRVTGDDRKQARAELDGLAVPEPTLADADSVGGLSRDPAEPRSLAGAQTPMRNEPDDQEIAEKLALGGVEEAVHEQMLAARRQRRDEP